MSFLPKLVGDDVRSLIVFSPAARCQLTQRRRGRGEPQSFLSSGRNHTELFGTLNLLRETLRSLRLCVYSQIGLETPYVVSYDSYETN